MDRKMQIAKPRERFTKLKNLGRRPRTLIGLLLFLTLAGCNNLSGSLPAEYGAPASILCDRGVPNAEGTACINAERCSDHSECTPPYKCNLATSACEPRVACMTKDDCNQNECIDGACHNPPVCIPGRATCIPGDYCDETTKTCMGGSCSLSNCRTGICKEGECANQERCTKENESTHCQAGFVCQRVLGQEYGACVEKNKVALDCSQGGIPDFFSHKCVNPPKGTCNNEDKKCIQGFYCLEKDHTCYTSFCNDSTCNREVTGSKGGVCDHDTGECVEPDTCTTSDVCFKGAYCVEGKCQNLEEVCRATCSGKQKCVWKDVEEDGVTCQDATHCEAKEDCVGQRICTAAGKCEDPPTTACVDDGNTNKSLDTAKDLPANEDFVLCNSNDLKEDWFAVNVISGHRLEITVTLDPLDVGKGKLTIEPFVKDGVNKNSLPYQVREQSHKRNEYVIILDAMNGDTKVYVQIKADDIHSTGITYKIRARQLIDKALTFCQNSLTNKLTLNNILSSNSNPTVGEGEVKANIEGLKQVCADSSAVVDQVWTLEVKEKQMVEISAVGLDSQSKTDLVLSLRRICYDSSTELACKNEKSGVQAEKIQEVLEPGFYSVLVGAPNQAAVGKYQILAKGYPLGCEPTNNSCTGDTLKYCKDYRVLEEKTCKKGCDVEAKACKEDLGKACTFAHPVQFNNENIYSANFNLSDYVSNKIISDSSCNATTTNTLGRNVFLKASVPAGSTLTGTLDYKDGDRSPDYSLYLLQDCHASTCLASSDRPGMTASETILWKNNTDDTKEVILVIDSNDLRNYTNKSIVTLNLALHSEDPCVPGTATCELGRMIKTCNPLSTGYDYTFCSPNGCTDDGDGKATCKPADGDSCTNAIDVTNTTLTDQSFEFVGDVYKDQSSACSNLEGHITSQRDIVYKVKTTKNNQIVTVELTPENSLDLQMWVMTECPSDPEGAMCKNKKYAVNEYGVGKKETLSFEAVEKGNYYIVVENADKNKDSNSIALKTFEVKASLKDKECTPNLSQSQCVVVSGSAKIKYCTEPGVWSYEDCESCEGALCTQTSPKGDTCSDPIILNDQTNEIHKPINNTSNHIEFPIGKQGQCVVPYDVWIPKGKETVYAIKLKKNDLFTAHIKGTLSQASAITSYILEDCFRTSSCAELKKGESDLSYFATEEKVIYLVIDSTNTYFGFFNLKWNIENTSLSYSCNPNTTLCSSNDEVTYCDRVGNKHELKCPVDWTCNSLVHACQPSDSWKGASGDTCTNPIIVAEDKKGTFLSFDSQHLTSQNSFTCSNILDQGGKDLYVKINVPQGNLIRAKGHSVNGNKPALVMLSNEDCSDGCTESSSSPSRLYYPGAYVVHKNETSGPKKYIVALDSPAGTPMVTDTFDFLIYTETPKCTNNDSFSCNNGKIKYCEDYLETEVFNCTSSSCAGDRCATRTGDICYDAIEVNLTSSSEQKTGSLSGLKNNFKIAQGSICGGSELSYNYMKSADIAYEVTIPSNKTLTVKAKSNHSKDIALFLVSSENNPNCQTIDNSTCLGFADNDFNGSTDEIISYKNEGPSPKKVFLIVDSYNEIPESDSEFIITFETN